MQINRNGGDMMESGKQDIRALTREELQEFFTSQGQKAFHGKQVYEWLWKKACTDFSLMTNLSKEARKILEEHFRIDHLTLQQEQVSSDGTAKMAFQTSEGEVIESVLIPSKNRATACISSQVGCTLACTFCATGKIPFRRNLTAGEIYDQVVAVSQKARERYNTALSNVVYMGMGEPLLNYDQVKGSIGLLTAEEGLGMSPRRITVSTVGIPDAIRRLADEGVRSELAVSLHAAIDETRSKLVPVNKKFGLDSLREALQHFNRVTGKRITFEYLMIRGVNDQLSHARALADYSRNFPVKINLIEYNEVEGTGFQKADPEQTKSFKELLESRNMIVNLRRSRGEDIDAACGQLAGKHKKK